MTIKEEGYRPTDKLDTSNPPECGSAIVTPIDLTQMPYHIVPDEEYHQMILNSEENALNKIKIIKAVEFINHTHKSLQERDELYGFDEYGMFAFIKKLMRILM